MRTDWPMLPLTCFYGLLNGMNIKFGQFIENFGAVSGENAPFASTLMLSSLAEIACVFLHNRFFCLPVD
jgi:hypothetical protein